MAYVIIRNENNRWQIGREVLAVCDTTADLDTIVEDIENICVGSRAIVTGTGIKYILCTDRKSWAPLASYVGQSVTVTRILYYSDDGSNLLHTEAVEPGSSGSWDGTPVREAEPGYEYVFLGWAREPNQTEPDETAVTDVTSERKVYAVYKRLTSGFLTFDGIQTLATANGVKSWDGTLFYSTDREQWSEWNGTEIAAGDDEKIYLRGSGNTRITGAGSNQYFVISGNAGGVACAGSIEFLLDYAAVLSGEHPRMATSCFSMLFAYCTVLTAAPALPATVLADNCYSSMFNGCTALTEAPALPATELADNCYSSMFNGCTALTEAPVLPATELAQRCYSSMFRGCTALTEAPVLPATELALSCYDSMFNGCTALTEAPALPATELAQSCYNSMFYGCTNLADAPALPATDLASSCYSSMFRGCTALTEAPTLPATELASSCYSSMFYGCTALTEAPVLPATVLADNCYSSMFHGCTNLADAPALPATELASSCYNSMFYGCTALTEAPVLPATELAQRCYSSMFRGCTALTEAPALPATELALSCYDSMFYDCAALTEAPTLPATELAQSCYSSMFRGCRLLTDVPDLPALTLADGCYYEMFRNCSQIKVSSTADSIYFKPFRIPTTGDGEDATATARGRMLQGTGGTFTGTPEINTTYYLAVPSGT